MIISGSHDSSRKDVIDNLALAPHSKGILHIGEVNRGEPRPKFRIKIHATVKENVTCTEKLLGDENHYIVTYQVENRNDSPAFVDAVLDENPV